MTIDFYVKSQQLLETLANSIHDREGKTENPFFFSINEVHAAERWLKELMEEINRDRKGACGDRDAPVHHNDKDNEDNIS